MDYEKEHLEALEVIERLCGILAERESELADLSTRIKDLEGASATKAPVIRKRGPSNKNVGEMDLLIAEHSSAFRNDLARMLEQSGFTRIFGTGTGRETYDLVRRKDFDIVFLDFNLPDSKGPDLVRKVRKVRPEAKIIVLMGNSDRKLIIECLEAGADDLLAKPVQAPVLQTRMEKHVNSSIEGGSV